MPSAAAIASCRNHPEREAIGICVECRTRVCTECVTKVDGINYCVHCLDSLAKRGGEHRRRAERPMSEVAAAFFAFGWFLVLSAMTWGLLEVALPGHG